MANQTQRYSLTEDTVRVMITLANVTANASIKNRMEVGKYQLTYGERQLLNKERYSMNSGEEENQTGDQIKYSNPIRHLEGNTTQLHQSYHDLNQ